jgi:hypothetical protein
MLAMEFPEFEVALSMAIPEFEVALSIAEALVLSLAVAIINQVPLCQELTQHAAEVVLAQPLAVAEVVLATLVVLAAFLWTMSSRPFLRASWEHAGF